VHAESLNSGEADTLLIDALEHELRSIGDELHDQLSQTLASTSLLIESLCRSIQCGKDVPLEQLEKLRNALDDAIEKTRVLSRRYKPPELEPASLMKLLHGLVGPAFRCEKPVFVTDPETTLMLYRIAQDLARAGATEIVFEDNPRAITLNFYFVDKIPERLVLKISRRRLALIGGELRLETIGGGGTQLRCMAPTRRKPAL
jgi:signal transduction histidine kinase